MLTPGAEWQPRRAETGQATLWNAENYPQFRSSYKYGYRKTKLVCDDISTTYDFHRHNKAGMLLKTLEC